MSEYYNINKIEVSVKIHLSAIHQHLNDRQD